MCKIINEMTSLTYGELQLLICLHFPMAATGIYKEGAEAPEEQAGK